LEVRRFYAPYAQETRGAPPFDPAMMVCLVLYADSVGVFASRNIALACERHLAFRAMVGEERPDFRTLSDVRTWHLEACTEVCVQVVRLAGEAGLVQVGTVSTDGTNIQGTASRQKAMSDGYRKKEVVRRREAIEALVTHAPQQDAADDAAWGSRRGEAWPAALARREDRLATIEAARRRLEAHAQAEAEAARQRRAEAEVERQRSGKQRRGQAPQPVPETPADKAQSTCTDPELPSMHTNNKGGEDCGNAHVRVDGACQIMLAWDVPEASNDTQQAEPMAQATLVTLAQAGFERPTDESGAPHSLPATLDNGSDSEMAGQALEAWGFDPSRATGRQRHHGPPTEAPETPASAPERMAAKVRGPQGKALYARRKIIVEPVFGQSKEARGFRRFLLRGLAHIRGEWRLVCLTHTLLKMWRYGRVLSAVYTVWRPLYGLETALLSISWHCGAPIALRRPDAVKGSDPSGRAIDMPTQGSKSHER
jgi:transposase